MVTLLSVDDGEEVTFSQVEETWRTVERVLVRIGKSRKRPAPAVPLPLKKEMPRRSWGRKPAVVVRARLGRAAWKGSVVMFVLELVGGWLGTISFAAGGGRRFGWGLQA